MNKILFILIFVFSFYHATAQKTAKKFWMAKLNTSLLTKLNNDITEVPSSPTATNLTTRPTIGLDLEVSYVRQLTDRYALTGAYAFGIFSYGYKFYIPKAELGFEWGWDVTDKFSLYRIIHNRISIGNRIKIIALKKQSFFLEGALDIYALRRARSKSSYLLTNDQSQNIEVLSTDLALSPPSPIQLGWNLSANYEFRFKENMSILINVYVFSTFNNIFEGEYTVFNKDGGIKGRLYNKITGTGISIGLVEDIFSK